MSKFASDYVLDGSLKVAASATRMLAVAGQPASFADAISGALTESPMAGGDFAFADGDISGRKLTVAAKVGLPVLKPGKADHVALVDDARLLYVTTCPAADLLPGGTVSIASWSIELGAPT